LGDAFPLWKNIAVYKHDDRLHTLVRQCLQILRRQNDEREIEVTSVAQLVAVFCYEFQDRRYICNQWNRLNRRYASSAFSEIKLKSGVSRAELNNSDVEAVAFLWSDCHLR